MFDLHSMKKECKNGALRRTAIGIGGIIFCLLCSSCPNHFMERAHSIILKNNSDRMIAYYASGNEFDLPIFPDTTLPVEKPYMQVIMRDRLGGEGGMVPWERRFEQFPSDTISLFVLDREIYDKTPWEEVREEYMVLQRYDVSLKDLQRLNFRLSYPPTAAMKSIKMYPPYNTDLNQ